MIRGADDDDCGGGGGAGEGERGRATQMEGGREGGRVAAVVRRARTPHELAIIATETVGVSEGGGAD